MEIKERLAEYGLNEAQYEAILKTCSDKINGDNDFESFNSTMLGIILD